MEAFKFKLKAHSPVQFFIALAQEASGEKGRECAIYSESLPKKNLQ